MNYYYIIIVLVFFGCEQKKTIKYYNGDINHPTAENLFEEYNINEIVNKTTPNRFDFSKTDSIGHERKQNISHIFGKIMGVVNKKNGNHILLDSKFNEIRFYDKKLNLLKVQKKAGRGPGEFLSPQKIVMGGNYVFIMDLYHKINKYKVTDDSLTFIESLNLKFIPVDIALSENSIFVRGVKSKDFSIKSNSVKIVHEYDISTFKYIESYGNSYYSNNIRVIIRLSDGPFKVFDNILIYSHEYFPYIISQDLKTQEILWVSKLINFSGAKIISGKRKDGRDFASYETVGNKSEQIISIQEWDKTNILLQTQVYNIDTKQYTINQYLIDKSTGSGIPLSFNPVEFILNLSNNEILTTNINGVPKLYKYQK